MAHRVLVVMHPDGGIHRIRNFGEALVRLVRTLDGDLPVERDDDAPGRLEIRNVHTRKLRRVLLSVSSLLDEHRLRADISSGRQPTR